MKKADWFASWFDSRWYPLLYCHRSEEEAAAFIRELVSKLPLEKGMRVCDLACGRGRHSRTLHALGFDVTGLDLSPNSIADAQVSESEHLRFFVHDMRRSFGINYYDAVFNLFTSFGYFDSVRDNGRVVDAVRSSLKAGGIFVIDFFNAAPVAQSLENEPYRMEKEIGGAHFFIEKKSIGTHVIKNIRVVHDGETEVFEEKVQLLYEKDFRRLLEPSFDILHVFGSYALEAFDEKVSDRLIIVARKKTKV